MKKSKILIIFLVFIILIVSMFISLKIGSIEITFKELIDGMFFGNNEGNIGIIKDLRMPRVIAGILIGANLSIAGVLLQAVIRNPLADPYVTGISSGASMTTVFFMVFMPQIIGFRPLFGFLGGLLCCAIIYFMAYKNGLSPIRIVLAGACCNALFFRIIINDDYEIRSWSFKYSKMASWKFSNS